MKKQNIFAGLAVLLLLASPALAFAEPWITLDRFSGNPGAVMVSGGGFGSNDTVTITGGSYASTTASVNEWGELAPVPLVIPHNTPQGSLSVTGIGSPSGGSAGNSYYVIQYSPSISASGANPTPGATVSVSGSGFAPNEAVRITLGSGSSTVTADGTGAFSGAVLVVPVMTPATYEIRGTGVSSGAVSNPVYFYIGGFYPSLVPSVYYVVPGGSLTLAGSGFAPNEEIMILSEGVEPLRLRADASGSFTTPAIGVPLYPSGHVRLFFALGQMSNARGSASVAVGQLYPSLIPSAYYVTPGSTLSFSGSGFAQSETVQIFEGASTSSLMTATTSGGSFTSSTITIPYSMSGSAHLFRARGQGSAAEASVSVTVGSLFPTLQPSSYFVLAGYAFNLSGTGFAPNETVNFTIGGSPSAVSAAANPSGNFFMAGPLRAGATSTGPVEVVARGATSGVAASVTLTIGRLYPTVTPSDYWLYPLQNLEFRGSGFVPEENVRIMYGTSTVGTVTANGFGNFTRSLTAPGRSGPAAYSFIGELSGAEARLELTVAGLYPSVTASNYYVAPGDQIFAQGTGFLSNEAIRIDVQGGASSTVTANGVGNVAPSIVTMPIRSGSVEIRMTGLTSGASAMTTVSLIPFSPQVTPSVWYAAPGSAISFTGSGFAPMDTVTMTVNGTSTGSYTASATGTVSISGLTLPFGSSIARYAFAGSLSGGRATVDVSVAGVNPWAWLSTYYAQPGMPLTVSGRGFGANEGVTISVDGTAFASTTADGTGGFDLAARVPQAPLGDRGVTATGNLSGGTGRTGITIAPAWFDLQLGQYAVAPGDAVRFFGGGYIPGETIEVRTDRTGAAVVHIFTADSAGRFDNSGFTLSSSTIPGNLTFTATGAWSQSPKSVTIYVTGG